MTGHIDSVHWRKCLLSKREGMEYEAYPVVGLGLRLLHTPLVRDELHDSTRMKKSRGWLSTQTPSLPS